MPLIPNPVRTVLDHVLQYRDRRHDVIAANIANSNTPGYRAFDLVLSDTLGTRAPLALQRTDPRHIASASGAASFAGESVASNAQPRLDGNNVSLEQEFIKLTENRIMYQTAFELRDKLGNLTTAAREIR